MLHTVNKSPFASNSLENCLRFLNAGDVILLLEDGVYAAAAATRKSPLIEQVLQTHKVYALSADLKARGITEVVSGVEQADYDKFVELLEAHNSQAWR